MIAFLTSIKDSLGVSYLTWEMPCPLLQLPQHLSIISLIRIGNIPSGFSFFSSWITKGGLWNQLVVMFGGQWHFAVKNALCYYYKAQASDVFDNTVTLTTLCQPKQIISLLTRKMLITGQLFKSGFVQSWVNVNFKANFSGASK